LSLEDIVERLVQIGPIAQMVREAPEAICSNLCVTKWLKLRALLHKADGMTLDGQFWKVTATALEPSASRAYGIIRAN
jgi:hypothetical protein